MKSRRKTEKESQNIKEEKKRKRSNLIIHNFVKICLQRNEARLVLIRISQIL